ncbi:MAG: thioredoxin family protein [Chthoniobacter sp.]|uniref:thioredoxin family protein n=1 Tax=Chthoniobacter sp. TaxID=2510640 RepID=UPI0032A8D7C4
MKHLSLLALALLAIAIPAHAAAPPGWTDDYAKAVTQAKAENKKLLLDFTGSDWCGYCMVLHKEVFSTAKFKDWAKQNAILVEVDFPRKKQLSKKLQAQNEELKGKFPFNGYPTIVVLDADGNELGRKTGYHPGSGPDAYLAELDAALKK